MLSPFIPKVYQDGAAGGTPILAVDLNALEQAEAADVAAITAGDVTNPASAASVALLTNDANASSALRVQQDARLSAMYVPRWTTATNYTAGDKVVSPNGDIVSAVATHTSTTFAPANWNLSAALTSAVIYAAGTYPARPATTAPVTYIGPVQPTTWITNDSWVDNS
jgi:hypothetical protein